ncbi:MAG: IS256 family transposase [Dehalococcoidia bacterium]
MCQLTTDSLPLPDADPRDVLTELLRDGARQMLTTAIEAEVAEWIASRRDLLDDDGHRLIVRNGHQPPRTIQTGIGPIEVRKPRVHDRRSAAEREPFESVVLPRYMRRTQSLDVLIPYLYLRGVSTGDFNEALEAILGKSPGLSASTVTRLVNGWQEEQREWASRSLADKNYVYVWADGVYFNIRLGDDDTAKQCILVLMGATADGKKELIAVTDGYRESKDSWLEIIRDLKRRGLTIDPKLAVGDGALGFWAAIREIWPATREQRCWVHKTANVLNKLPRSMQAKAKARLHEIWQAATRKDAHAAFDGFVEDFEAKYPKAVECLAKDRRQLLTFYDFPAEHWRHLRTTNPIESTFATIRHRHRRTKGNGNRAACLAMVFKLAQAAEQSWRKLNGHEQLTHVIHGVQFIDGERKVAA